MGKRLAVRPPGSDSRTTESDLADIVACCENHYSADASGLAAV
jgi:hypothetical protein